MNHEILLTLIVVIITAVSLTTILYVYTENEVKRLDDEVIKAETNEIELISSRFALRLQYATGIVEMNSQIPPISKAPLHADLITEELKGIPEDADNEKREIAKKLLEKNFDFDYVFYALPNGDIYFLEPFDSQINLSQLNFAFRDWYRGVINTGSTYVSEVYVSANELHNVIGIASPIYNDANNLIGIFVAALSLSDLQKALSESNLGQNEYVLIVDHNGNIVADSRQTASDTEVRKFMLNLNQWSKNDGVNVMIDDFDGQKTLLVFKTVPVGNHDWSVISIQPHIDAFKSSHTIKNEAFFVIVIMILVLSISGLFMLRKIIINLNLSNKLKTINEDLKSKTEQIRQIDIKKEEFSAMVTHELKTPLTPILWSVKILKDEISHPEHLELIETIEKNTKHLELLISDIMDARKLDLGKMKFNIESVLLDDLFADLESAYKNQLLQKGITFTIQSEMGMKIQSDKDRLRQVFDNLIGNAIKFVPSGTGVIQVSAKKEYDHIIISVKDNGPGIPAEKQKDLFKKFYQVDTSERRKIGGTGLGLAISKGIMENLKGKIWIESDGKNGTAVYLSLPF